ncbi:type IV pilus assembly protein PilA [Oceanobacillus limi]|uniref:Type IV pilus assembly protein PilA n=1 Tax=Oceanobacillus limi TaxID=930131 RepID=A0A1I0EK33_9BACI|nr:prepilin-type N-terminal cleavage/methylation domain-containing protein [Oceanobacillus limi]SET45019.1 type IV pilus assembly protein PilA [Oceanobacillus limi]
MLKQVWKKWKKEKGFTLVELLAVIAILGIILAIAVPAIGNVIDDSKEDAYNANIELILNAARLADVSGDFTDDMTPEALHNAGYLQNIPKNPYDETEFKGTVSKSSGTFSYNAASGESTP